MKLPNPLGLRWADTLPFPHVVIDGVIDREHAAAIADEFPPPDSTAWHTFGGPLEHGKQEGAAGICGPFVADVHTQIASAWFVLWLRELTGIADLRADPHRTGGGVHQSGPTARLGVHVDFNLHPHDPTLVRAVNVILFVTDARGAIELWGDTPPRCLRAYEPRAGRLIVFEASDRSWHGHPVPLGPYAPLRKSIPAYYFRPVRDGEQIEARSTRFLADVR